MLSKSKYSPDNINDAPLFFENRQETILLRSGFQMVLGDFDITTQKDFYFQSSEDVCEFVFVLSGEFTNKLPGAEDIIVQPLFSALWLTPKLQGHHACKPGSRIKFVCIRIKRNLLIELSGEFISKVPKDLKNILEQKENRLFYKFTKMNIPMQSAAHQIFQCPYKGSMKKLFLQSKALELISHFMISEFDENPEKNDSLPKKDKINIENARDILINNIENPLSLPELARQAGISETKLTRGFRKLYGTSVFEYLRNHRMEKAKLLLESGELNITEISYIIGYSSPSHFTRVFTKYFGTSPKNYQLGLKSL